ncbi:hypothetical protein MCP1_310046 [Candidatus Terasakiella magnetica]|nr:hypothetical protein MCP1_310046 [Candidatus Terasakiella magnetica]
MTHPLPDTVEAWPIDRLIPYGRNARTHSDSQVAQIAASMVEFGWTNPVLADSKGNVIAGHGRLPGSLPARMAAPSTSRPRRPSSP